MDAIGDVTWYWISGTVPVCEVCGTAIPDLDAGKLNAKREEWMAVHENWHKTLARAFLAAGVELIAHTAKPAESED